jgi:uncharacterized RDD family membrane protein YckC
MNLENTKANSNNLPQMSEDLLMDDFDFKPITSGLGFHQPKQPEVKVTSYAERSNSVSAHAPASIPLKRNEAPVYQNDLSIFYGNHGQMQKPAMPVEEKTEVVYRNASKAQRSFAYILDLSLVVSFLGLVLTIMSRCISMDLMEVWNQYPNEITPLVLTLFCGFYFIYFSIFEKAQQSTLGKNLLGLRVVDTQNKVQSFQMLLLRSFVTLANFVSLGLFSYFDLQNKVTNSKVIQAE